MIIKETIAQKIEKTKYVICDKCGKKYSSDVQADDWCFEAQEFHHISFTGGFGSVFGDMISVECDLCQHCLKEMIGNFCRMKDERGYDLLFTE